MNTKKFWISALERSVVAAAAAFLSTLGAGAVDLFHAPVVHDLELSASTAVVMLITSVAASNVTGNASFIKDTD
ncbi:holin [Tsukamurella soli]|uniref:Holin n=1 Tax=Tsukamurella soli TaxID=644556 RepID=A0ABP8K3J3_9ACTN